MDDHASLAVLNGVRALPMLLATHTPIDLVVIMLGTNDLKPHLCGKALGAAFGMRRLAQIVATYPFGPGEPRPSVLLVAPPIITAPTQARTLDCFVGAASESHRLAGLYRDVASEQACGFFDAGTVSRPSPVDGVHLDADNTRAIGLAVAPIVRTMLRESP